MGVRIAGDFVHLLGPGPGEEPWYVNDHTFVHDHGGTWHLIGITHPEPMAPFDELELLHATAPALLGPWERHAPALTTSRTDGETHLWAPHVIEHDGTFWMFYCAGGPSPAEYRIHLATSTDCWTWQRHPANPLIVDGYEARDPMVLRVDDRWVMYYTATEQPTGGHHVVVAAESDDLVLWHGRRVVYHDRLAGTGAGPTESPFVVRENGRSHLFIGPDFEGLVQSKARTGRYDRTFYRRTRVLASADALHFDDTDEVATLDVHAAEIITDEHGDRWISHCGWGEGGIFVAPLRLG